MATSLVSVFVIPDGFGTWVSIWSAWSKVSVMQGSAEPIGVIAAVPRKPFDLLRYANYGPALMQSVTFPG